MPFILLILTHRRYNVRHSLVPRVRRHVVGKERPDILGVLSLIEFVIEAEIGKSVLLEARVEILRQDHLLEHVRWYPLRHNNLLSLGRQSRLKLAKMLDLRGPPRGSSPSSPRHRAGAAFAFRRRISILGVNLAQGSCGCLRWRKLVLAASSTFIVPYMRLFFPQ